MIADVTARRLRPINCGDWTHQARGVWLKTLGIREIAFHNAPFRTSSLALSPAWFAWRGLVQHGYRPFAHDGEITILDRFHGQGPPPKAPVAEPSRSEAWLCSGWYPNDGNGRAMSYHRSVLWVYGSVVRLQMRSNAAPRRPFLGRREGDADPEARTAGRVDPAPTREARLAPRHPGHAGTLPHVGGRKEGARLLSYVLGSTSRRGRGRNR